MSDPIFFVATWLVVTGFAFILWLAVDTFIDNVARARRGRRHRLTVLDVINTDEVDR